MNKINSNDTLARMKSLMNYGLQTESKNKPYSTVEYQKIGADGKVYGIVREGTNYFIKVAPNKSNLLKEDFSYIGGFRNRKDYQYDSYANAQKQFDLKMMSLKEAANNKNYNVESWDLDKKENVVVEASEKMRKEILREHQIMKNAMAISEKKAVCCDDVECPKDNIKKENPKTGDAKSADKTFSECGEKELPKEMTNESEQVLGWNRGSDDYMDKSHGTEIGDSAPFDDATARNIDDGDKKVTKTGEMKNGVVENHGTSMHDAESQDTPSVGVGEGPSDDNNKPFDDKKGKQIDEAIDDLGDDDFEEEPMDDDLEGGDEDFGANEEPMDDDLEGGEDFGDEEPLDDEPIGDEEPLDDEEPSDDIYEDDVQSRLDSMEELINAIAEKLGITVPEVDEENYEDDDLFDDEDGDDEQMSDEFGGDEESYDDEMPMESRKRNGVQIVETANFKKAMRRAMNEEGMTPFTDNGRVPANNMNKLDDFGKHPAYQKKVMSLPPKDMQEFPGYYDMNDDSVRNDEPYGEKIGDGAPFEIDPEVIDNAIAEAVNRLALKKKSNRR